MSRQANVNWLISVFYRAVLSLPFACRSSSRDPGAAAPDRRAPTLCLRSDRSYLWRIVCSGPGYLEHNPIGDRRSSWSNPRPSSPGGAYGSSTSRLIWASLVNSFSRIGMLIVAKLRPPSAIQGRTSIGLVRKGKLERYPILSARDSRNVAFARSVFDKVDVTGSHAYLFSS